MNYDQFLDEVIDGGIAGARKDYANKKEHLRGALAGFAACRDKTPTELAELLADARNMQKAALASRSTDYWYHRCYEAEVEWVCNCISAMMVNERVTPIINPTARGAMRAAEILRAAN